MAEGPKQRLKSCAVGCGVLVLVPVLVVLVVSVRTCVPLRTANRDLARLEARLGPADTFTPAVDGSIPAERIGAFLEIRRSMMVSCGHWNVLAQKIQRVDQLEETEPRSGREVADATKELVNVVTEITPFVAEFFERRNRSLLDAEMGLGEYSYIYVLAYREPLLDKPHRGDVFSTDELFSADVRTTLRTVLVRQRDRLIADGADEKLRRPLEREIDAMKQDSTRVPWQDGLPDPIAAALEPHQRQLDGTFCRGTVGIALDRNSRRALSMALY